MREGWSTVLWGIILDRNVRDVIVVMIPATPDYISTVPTVPNKAQYRIRNGTLEYRLIRSLCY